MAFPRMLKQIKVTQYIYHCKNKRVSLTHLRLPELHALIYIAIRMQLMTNGMHI